MDEDEVESDGLNGSFCFMVCLILTAALAGSIAIIFFPNFRPKQVENVFEPIDQILYDCQELLYNSFHELNFTEPKEPKVNLYWDSAKGILEKRILDLDGEIEKFDEEDYLIPTSIPRTIFFREFRENSSKEDFVPPAVKLIHNIKKLVDSIAEKNIQYYKIRQENDFFGVAESSNIPALVTFKLDELSKQKSILANVQKTVNLMSLYNEKLIQLRFLTSVNGQTEIYERLSAAFNMILGNSIDNEVDGENDVSMAVKRNDFIAAVQNATGRFLINTRCT